uniref:Ig-like domain-containing protein n=1 Tax=Photinus pyralis TaxID=7054 RepID=A0A1Y1MV23_PHOPY
MCGIFLQLTPIHELYFIAYVTCRKNMVMHIAITFIIAGCFTLIPATREVERPSLVIEAGHTPLHGNTINVNYGENVSLNCLVYPNHHTVLWQINNRRLKPSNHIATLDFSNNAQKRELGIYKCRSPSANLQRTLHVVKKRHWYREDDDPSNYEQRSIAVETFHNWFNDWKMPPNVPSVNEDLNPHSEKETQNLEEGNLNRKTQRIHNIGVVIGGVGVGAVLLGLVCVLWRDARKRKRTLVLGDQQQTPENAEILPDAIGVTSNPAERTAITDVLPSAPEGPLPPSYEEAIRCTAPSAPKI